MRFDHKRSGLFHYVLYAHTRGRPKSLFPCLVNGQPANYDVGGTACTTTNPEFHIPSSAGGIADLPGGNVLVTLGRWDGFVGKPFVRASTTFHEIGHNLDLTHGGTPVVLGQQGAEHRDRDAVEPNCKPNYLSSMSYAFQVHGLLDDGDEINFDYSGDSHHRHRGHARRPHARCPLAVRLSTRLVCTGRQRDRGEARSPRGHAVLHGCQVRPAESSTMCDGARLYRYQCGLHRLERRPCSERRLSLSRM